ncbi:hypothetical protein KVR01_013028 [Diaporthe batatas]|uniref:uncharacterized protein n=1 Tax=Diaporthe batatas TaxID=748121 RepID=UPI001D051662|nr:uncharacterized protein KVR01_013028 [Diaporthe batatas]KAG8157038.1 hypothetical protein KVR01_013028 [Diaporthe batatas]
MPYTSSISPDPASTSIVQASSSDNRISTAAQQGSTTSGTVACETSQVQQPHGYRYGDESKEDRMKLDLLHIGSQFQSSK